MKNICFPLLLDEKETTNIFQCWDLWIMCRGRNPTAGQVWESWSANVCVKKCNAWLHWGKNERVGIFPHQQERSFNASEMKSGIPSHKRNLFKILTRFQCENDKSALITHTGINAQKASASGFFLHGCLCEEWCDSKSVRWRDKTNTSQCHSSTDVSVTPLGSGKIDTGIKTQTSGCVLQGVTLPGHFNRNIFTLYLSYPQHKTTVRLQAWIPVFIFSLSAPSSVRPETRFCSPQWYRLVILVTVNQSGRRPLTSQTNKVCSADITAPLCEL